MLLIKSGSHRQLKRTLEEFKTFDLVDVNGSLWYGVPIFTFWRDQVDKGSMPEPDISNNYIGLYKTHEDTSRSCSLQAEVTDTQEETINKYNQS